MKRFCISICLLFLSIQAFTQDEGHLYLVQFQDKLQSSYSIHKPYEFLSSPAIIRRQQMGIAIDSSDLPVSNYYLNQIKKQGARLHNVSKWMNSAVVNADKSAIKKIGGFYFVKSIKKIGKKKRKALLMRQRQRTKDLKKGFKRESSHYGQARQQIEMLNGHYLHQRQFKGQQVLIAVLDGGFVNMDISPFFDSLRQEARLLPSKDFVDQDSFVTEYTKHGTQVLSVMAANIPHLMVGTAPNADYICLVTEEEGAETPVEEENYIAALEYADSIGAKIINASLGYTTFDDSRFNYQLSDLDGETARASHASNIASQKGMLLVISAGNSGNDNWRGLGVPADALDVLTVASVNRSGARSYFSSYGFIEKAVKPNVAAMGSRTVTASVYGYHLSYANGTSFAAPVISGLAASLWSAFPEASNWDIKHAIEESSSLFNHPTSNLGFGLPDFEKAYNILFQKYRNEKPINWTEGFMKGQDLFLME